MVTPKFPENSKKSKISVAFFSRFGYTVSRNILRGLSIMKTVNVIVKILAALAAVAGVVYIVATYGDKIVAWAKNLLGCAPCDGECEACDCECFEEADVAAEEAAEEVVEEVVEEVADEEPVAAESDFEG
jgi:hypothetical protein